MTIAAKAAKKQKMEDMKWNALERLGKAQRPLSQDSGSQIKTEPPQGDGASIKTEPPQDDDVKVNAEPSSPWGLIRSCA